MHDNLTLILTLTGGLGAALVLGYIANWLKLSPIVGYLLAGIVVGPTTPGFVADPHLANQLAEVGIILLMFGVGLHFHFKELLAVRRIALPGALVQSLVATALGALITWWLGWNLTAGIVYGLAISVASTVVLTRVLIDNHDLHTPTGHIAMGWLVVEDLFTVIVLVLLPAIFGPKNVAAGELPLALGLVVVKIVVLVVLVSFLGARFVPWLLTKAAAAQSRELFTLTILVVALGVAVGSAKLFGVSMALGAFLAGMVVGRTEFSLRAASEALPMRDAFAVLFFVSVGMLFDPQCLVKTPLLIAATLFVVIVGKPLAALAIVWLLRYPFRVALAVAVALAQIGEFSFIMATIGMDLKVLTIDAMNALVAAAIVSISINALLYRWVDPLDAWVARHPRVYHLLNRAPRGQPAVEMESSVDPTSQSTHRAVVVGYGPVGQTLARLLRDNEIEPTIIEMNLDTVKRLREDGLAAVYGDAAHHETLQAAGTAAATSLLLTVSSMANAQEVIRQARELNPAIRVLVRCNYLRDQETLGQAGADRVFSGEGEVALAMTESLLKDLGAFPEQIYRERARVRADLFGSSP